MAMFASRLYPQTNPTNPVLLNFRDYGSINAVHLWMEALDEPTEYAETEDLSAEQIDHARHVLSRLASLTG